MAGTPSRDRFRPARELLCQQPLQPSAELFRFFLLAFPNGENPPAELSEFRPFFKVPRGISLQFRLPPGIARLWNPGLLAIPVQMPESSVNKNNRAMPRHHNIRLAG